MSHAADAGRRPVLCGDEVPPAGHICAFFRSDDEKYATLAPFFTEALRNGDRVINAVEQAGLDAHVRRLEKAGVPVAAASARDDLRVRSCEEIYARNGSLDLEAVLDMLRDALSSARAEGRCVRTCGEMSWVARNATTMSQVLDYESRVNDLLPPSDCTLICVYDLSRTPATIVSDILATHPYAIINGRLRENPYAVPMDEYREMLRVM